MVRLVMVVMVVIVLSVIWGIVVGTVDGPLWASALGGGIIGFVAAVISVLFVLRRK